MNKLERHPSEYPYPAYSHRERERETSSQLSQFVSGNLGSSTYLRHCDLIGRVHEMRRVVIDVGHAHNKRNVALLIRLAYGAGNL